MYIVLVSIFYLSIFIDIKYIYVIYMNRIRKVNNIYQVLITPDFKISPDSSVLIGNWDDESFRNFYILQFESLNDAQYEALKYPDIDWYKLTLNHSHIFKRLEYTIKAIIDESGFQTEFRSHLLDPESLKNTFMDRVQNAGERFNLRYSVNDIISFTIVNPWTNNLHYISKILENYRSHLYRDDLRIKNKKIVDGKIICLYGFTEFGTIYEIKLVPTLLDQWASWYKKNGFRNEKNASELYVKYIKMQDTIDNGPVVR